MKPLKIEIMMLPASHPEHGTGMEIVIDNNIAATIDQFSEDSQRNIRLIFNIVAGGVDMICSLNHEHASKIQCPVDSELGNQFVKRFKQPEEGK
jgi:hypothetical protein